MIQFKRTAFIVFTSLTPFTAAFAKTNPKKIKNLKSMTSSGGHDSGDSGYDIEAVVINTNYSKNRRSAVEAKGPVVLYKDGTACLDIALLSTNDDIETIKAEHPEGFASWDYNDQEEVELRSSLGGLGGLTMTARVDPLPKDFRLEHNYAALSHKSSAPYSNYQFLEDGTFYSGDSVGGDFKNGSVNPAERGQYVIDGYSIQLIFDDGHVESKTIVADSVDNSVIWIDGETYIDQN